MLAFLSMSYITHLTWEFGWLVAHNLIIDNPDSPWTFIWWAYIDGGDRRYTTANPLLLSMEFLSVCNGILGAIALWLFVYSKSKKSVLLMAATSVIHLYSALLYYLTEVLEGFPNVAPSFISFYIKFFLANSPWVIVPWFVFWWALKRVDGNRIDEKQD